MEFPVGSLLVTIAFILITSGAVKMGEYPYKILVLGLAGVLLGAFLILPLPVPKGIQATLNTGHTLVPLLIAAMFWLEASAEERYRISLEVLAVGLTLYGFAALLEIEPGLIEAPLLFSVPASAAIAAFIGRTPLAAAVGLVGGCQLVTFLRYFELTFWAQPGTVMELPGTFLWNTLTLGITGAVGTILVAEKAQGWLKERRSTHSLSEAEQEVEEADVSILEGD